MKLPFNIILKKELEALNTDYRVADKNMMWILLVHAFFAVFVTSSYYHTYMLGIVGSAVILSIASIAYWFLCGSTWFRLISALSLMLFTAIFIQQHLGRIEMHFHVFIALAILTIYKDTLPMFFASTAIVIHHFLFNYFQSQNYYFNGDPVMIFSYGCGIEYVYLHGAMVAAEAVVLGYIIRYITEQFLRNIQIQSELDLSNTELQHFNEGLEKQVRDRTKELEEALQNELKMIEDLKNAKEEADSANRLKSEFLANMSHEIRTPLNAVIGFSDLLEDELKEPKHIGYLEAIKNGGKTLLSLINDILDLSKIEAGHMTIKLHPTRLQTLVENVIHLFAATAKNKGIELSVRIDPALPQWLIIDEVHVRQVLINLISNAIKFTHEGSVKLLITCQQCDDGDIDLIFDVADTGVGISEKSQKKIFEAFIQADGQDARQYGGTGLGLSICHKLAHLMSGDLKVASELGKGSVFTFLLHGVERSEAILQEQTVSEEAVAFEPKWILVVDDVMHNRMLLKELLKGYGFNIEEASDGGVALEHLREKPFDLVLMDIRMPNVDGWQAMQMIKDEFDDRSFPVIAVTASVMKHDHARINQTFDGLLEKPIDRPHLLSLLKHYLPYSVEAEPEEVIKEDKPSVAIEPQKLQQIYDKLCGLEPMSLSALESGDIDIAMNFSAQLTAVAEEFGSEKILEYAQNLLNACEGFDIAMVESLLKNYAQFVQQWSQLI